MPPEGTIVARSTGKPPRKDEQKPVTGAWRAMLNLFDRLTARVDKSDNLLASLELRVKELSEQLSEARAQSVASFVIDAEGNLIATRANGTKDNLGRVAAENDKGADREETARLIADGIARAVAALPKPKDGESVTAEQLAPIVDQAVARAVAALPKPKDGESVTVEQLAPVVQDVVEKAVAALPKPKDGESVTAEALRPMVEKLVVDTFAAMPKPKDGEDADMEKIEQRIVERVAYAVSQLPKPKDGESVTVDDIKPVLALLVNAAVAELPKPQDGKDADPAEVERLVNVKLSAAIESMPKPKDGEPGRGIAKLAIKGKSLVVTFTDSSEETLGQVVGDKGKDAKPIAVPKIEIGESYPAQINAMDLDRLQVRTVAIGGETIQVLTP